MNTEPAASDDAARDALAGAVVDAWGRALIAGLDEQAAAETVLTAARVVLIEAHGPEFVARLLARLSGKRRHR